LPISPETLPVISSVAEAVMLACFGASWPFSVAKSIRVKKVTGKSPVFLFLVLFGYLAGMVFKLANWDNVKARWILLLYIYNFSIVGVDTILYFRYRKNG
jgi:hypothetical protein